MRRTIPLLLSSPPSLSSDAKATTPKSPISRRSTTGWERNSKRIALQSC